VTRLLEGSLRFTKSSHRSHRSLLRPTARRTNVGFALALALGLGACGLGRDRSGVEHTVDDLYAAFAAQDAARACSLLTAAGRREISAQAAQRGRGGSCEQVMSRALKGSGDRFGEAVKARVTEVKVDGDTAQATVSLRGVQWRVGLAKEGSTWKVYDLNLGAGR
jgi:hypothetical protein